MQVKQPAQALRFWVIVLRKTVCTCLVCERKASGSALARHPDKQNGGTIVRVRAAGLRYRHISPVCATADPAVWETRMPPPRIRCP